MINDEDRVNLHQIDWYVYKEMVVPLPATPRHTNPPLWLLPSRPDQVYGLSLRGDQ